MQDFREHHPNTAALVIEIAISSVSLDREKASLYAEAGVEEYWIILPVERRVEVHRRPQDGSYLDHAVVEGETVLTCGSLPAIPVHLVELFSYLSEPSERNAKADPLTANTQVCL